jgi:hypothetical protein
MKRFLKRSAIGLLLVAIVGGGWYGVVAYRYWSNPPKITRNYSEELNAPVRAVPENERAWPIYREVMTKLARTSTDASLRVRECQDVPFVVPDRPKAAATLRREAALLERVRATSRLKSMGHLLSTEISREDRAFNARHSDNWNRPQREQEPPVPPEENPPLSSVKLQPAKEIQELTNLLAADACLAARDGNARLIVDDLSAMIGIAEHVRELPMPENDECSALRFSETMRTWGYLMQTSPELFEESGLRRLEEEARSFAGGKLEVRTVSDRMWFADILQRCYTDDGHEDGRFFAPAAGDAGVRRYVGSKFSFGDRVEVPLKGDFFLSRRESETEFDRLMTIAEADLKRPLWEYATWQFDKESAALKKDPRYGLVLDFLRDYFSLRLVLEDATQQRDAILTVAALLRYRLKHGGWPDKLDTLVPELLAELPRDRRSGKALHYRLIRGKPILFSLGEHGGGSGEGNRVDESATALVDAFEVPDGRPPCWCIYADGIGLGTDLALWPVISPHELAEGRSLVEKEPEDEGVTPP